MQLAAAFAWRERAAEAPLNGGDERRRAERAADKLAASPSDESLGVRLVFDEVANLGTRSTRGRDGSDFLSELTAFPAGRCDDQVD